MRNIISRSIASHQELVEKFEKQSTDRIIEIVDLIVNSLIKKGKIYLCGNGGSAADAQHVAGELIGRFKKDREPLPAISLNTDSSVLTCISNDYDFNHIFSRQLEALITQADILWVFSTSGASVNIVNAVKCAKRKKAKIIAFTGIPGSILEKDSDICVCSETKITSKAQEIHQIAYHIVCELVEIKVCNNEYKKKNWF